MEEGAGALFDMAVPQKTKAGIAARLRVYRNRTQRLRQRLWFA